MIPIHKENFIITEKGEQIEKFTLKNKNGFQVEIINFGAIITSILVPNKNGKFDDVVLGFKNPEDYLKNNSYTYGAVVGRYANRISNGTFTLEGKEFHLTKNDGENHIHGGKEGFALKMWTAEIIDNAKFPTLKLKYFSKDGEEGFPGNLQTEVEYSLDDDNTLNVKYKATTDVTTIVNLTQHSYFNLSGKHSQKITDHELQLNAEYYLPIQQDLIPTGELQKVEKTPFDFREFKKIGKDIDSDEEQLRFGKGYDHCWVLSDSELRTAGNLYHPKTGRNLEILTTEPGIQFYSGNFLDGKFETKTGEKNHQRTGVCLETQHFPDSPNQKNFPSTIIFPEKTYKSKTVFRFSLR